MKKGFLVLVCSLILFNICGCDNIKMYDTTIYRCGSIQDEEYAEFTYYEHKDKYIKLKYYYQEFDISEEDIENGLDEYKEMVSNMKEYANLDIKWSIKNNKLIESTEIDLDEVNDKFITKLENVGEKYEFTESVEGIYYGLTDYFYSDGKVSHNKISEFISENNCEIVE